MAKPAKPTDLSKKSIHWLQRARQRAPRDGDDAEAYAIARELRRRQAATVLGMLSPAQQDEILQFAKQHGFITRMPRRS